MTLVSSSGSSRWYLGFGALTGAVYYLTNSTNRQHLQTYVYHTISNAISELTHLNIILLLMVFIVSCSRINYNLISLFSNIGSMWSKPTINAIFLCLRMISAIKLLIALLRGIIKTRRIGQSRALCNREYGSEFITATIERANNRCIICFDTLSSGATGVPGAKQGDHDDRYLVLDCQHIYHYECFKQWYMASDRCPCCRKKVEL